MRGGTFVTCKIIRAVAAIRACQQEEHYLCNLDAPRDRGDTREYALGMWMTMQQDEDDDYGHATSEITTAREFLYCALPDVGSACEWEGSGIEEPGRFAKTGRALIEVDPRYHELAEADVTLLASTKQLR